MTYKIILKENLLKQDVCFVSRYKQTATKFYNSDGKIKDIMFSDILISTSNSLQKNKVTAYRGNSPEVRNAYLYLGGKLDVF
jgi:hypothetical protein